ncbi:MAG: DUF6496 domain-containing protein [Candidatus Methanosuratincola sp.]
MARKLRPYSYPKTREGRRKFSEKVRIVMREFKEGRLRSSSGHPVRNPKQAIAIALSEARRAYERGATRRMWRGRRRVRPRRLS